MSYTLENLTALLGQGQNTAKLGSALGASATETDKAVSAVGPALVGGLADKANGPDGESAIGGLLDQADSSILGNLGGFFDGGGSTKAASLVGSIFGSSQPGMVSGLARSSGLSSGLIGKAVSMLAPVVAGIVAKRRTDEGLSTGRVASLLSREKAELSSAGLLGSVPGAASAKAAGRSAVSGARSASTAAAGSVGSVATASKGGGIGRWLWPVLGLLGALLLMAWALTQCGTDDGKSTSADSSPTTADAGDDNKSTSTSADKDDKDDKEANKSADADIKAKVDAALGDVTGAEGVSAAVDADGVVTLTGAVETEEAKTAAEEAASAVEGVEEVKNEITVGDDTGEEPKTVNEELSLDPITFQTGSAVITPEGIAVLDKAVAYFETNSEVEFEIGGHTDSDGNPAANVTLSESRAQAVADYLTENGIDEARMTTKGYGDTVPKVENDTEENKAINRRIEFTVTN